MDAAADIFPTIEESSFCSNFQCCGRSLKDLHELLHHYEDSHVRIEDGDEDTLASSGFDFDTVLAADSLLNVGAEASSNRPSSANFTSAGGLLTPTPSSLASTGRPSPHSKRPRILTLGIEPCDYANDDSEHLSAFDNTVIRPIDPNRMYNGHHGYTRIAPKRSHSVPAIPNIPLLTGESGFKLIHSILSSTADPLPSESSAFLSNSSGSSSAAGGLSSSGYPATGYTRSNNDRPFVCPVSGCGKTYKNANGLKYHAIHGHDGVLVEKPHKCPFAGCGKRYKNSNGLKYHFQHAHPNTPPPSSLSMTSSIPSGYSSHASFNRLSHQGYTGSFAASTSLQSTIQPPSRPHSNINTVSGLVPPPFNRPAPVKAPSTIPSAPTTLQSEAVQNLLAAAPNTIASLLKKNPNLKQHLPTILRNLQQFAIQKSNNNNNNNSNNISNEEKKPPSFTEKQ